MAGATRKRRAKSNTSGRRTAGKRSSQKRKSSVSPEIYVIGALAFCILLFVSNINLLGVVGKSISAVEFGLFGICAFVFPLALAAAIILYFLLSGTEGFLMKYICGILIFVDVCVVAHLFVINDYLASHDNPYKFCSENHTGGGLLGGYAAVGLYNALGLVGAWLVSLLIFIICLMIVTEASLFDIIASGSDMIEDRYHETSRVGRERYEQLREKNEQRKAVRRERREREEEMRRERQRQRLEREEREAKERQEREKEKQEKDPFVIPLVGETPAVQAEPETAEEPVFRDNAPSIKDGEIIFTEDETDDMPEIVNPVDVQEIEAIYEQEHPEEPEDEYEDEESRGYFDEEDEPLFTVDELCEEEFDFDAFSLERMRERAKRRELRKAGMTLRDEEEETADGFDGGDDAANVGYALEDETADDNPYGDGNAVREDMFVSSAGGDDAVDDSGSPVDEDADGFEAGENYDATGDPQMADDTANDGDTADDAVPADREKPQLDLIETKHRAEKKGDKSKDASIFSLTDDGQRTSSGGKVFTEKTKAVASKEEKKKPKKHIKYRIPTLKDGLLNVIDAQDPGDVRSELEETKEALKDALDSFGIKVTMGDASRGPTVTRYEMVPQRGTKVSKIVNLSDDLKMALGATDIRIEAPIPGKHAVGIEVPNNKTTMVSMYELLNSKSYKDFKGGLSFAVGKDLSGETVVADITKMPHVLIAGTTGSGKSVCVNTMLMSILFRYTPYDVKLILIDPKVVELSVYNDIPHLLIPVVTDPKKASNALLWGVREMDERYEKFAQAQVRDLEGFNEYLKKCADEDKNFVYEPLPKIVIIVDELADLMMTAKNEVEDYIIRLLQKARACGIHLVIATQRPSVDVITGLIKANVPSRIAFSVKQGVDSQTILDERGAEKLLGKGDMLFYPAGYPKPARLQGAFVSDEEVRDVVAFWGAQTEGDNYDEGAQEILNAPSPEAPSKESAISDAGDDGKDVLFAEAGRFIIDSNKASTGSLQRKFRIGFNRAARIMDQLCEAGVVGPENGTKPREILMSREQFENAAQSGEI